MEVQLQSHAVDGKADREQETGNQRVGQAELGVLDSADAARDGEGDAVVGEVAVELGSDYADPRGHGEEGELERREAVAAGRDGGHEVDCEGGGLHDGESEGDEDKGSDEEGDGCDRDLEGDDEAALWKGAC